MDDLPLPIFPDILYTCMYLYKRVDHVTHQLMTMTHYCHDDADAARASVAETAGICRSAPGLQ